MNKLCFQELTRVHSGGGPPTPFIDETAIKKEDDLVSDIDITYFGTLNSDLNCSSNSFDDIPQDLSLNSQRIHMESLFKCSLDNVISPEPEVPGTMITPLSEADHYLNCKQEYENPGREYSKLLLEQSLENISPFISATEKVEDIDSQQNSVDDCLPGPTFSPGVLRALPFSEPAWAALEKITAYSRDIRKDPEAIKQLIKKVKDYLKLRQQRMEGKDTEDELFGHTDHTYVTQRKTNVIHHYKCSQCGKLFPKNCRHRFLSHMRTHTGERPFKCNVCGRGFSRQDHVQVHMRLHTGEKPFKCTSCDASYAHKVSLKSHKCEQYRAKQRKEMEQTQEDTHQMQNENNVKVTESEKSLVTSTDILGCHGKSMDTLCNKPNSSNLESRNYTDIKTDGVERPMPKLVPV
ncbi:hypothetical protein SK128_028478 [Halocaridina rubra]|uniref:C2H2-type domain-containing protein n=1 Tax=Halocaridina rubra TaxID=373956 RepID=A0AAN8WW71_HALRR